MRAGRAVLRGVLAVVDVCKQFEGMQAQETAVAGEVAVGALSDGGCG